ncbi:HAD family hydrolase [Halonotius terrestris]|uniref:HAD family hydrolase n=1 Tax=Halonotius terrestris TaxID=2487750 RepID=A0A8J8PBS1_9EURY|nr:HAD family hydrolase [Halonotius terrestris]TQQ80923.1 HAD family hydrolase [Halonotius terrestris]
MSIRGVAFDLDDTLAVPNRDRETLLAEAVDQADAPPISRSEYIQAHRNHLTTESRTPIFAELLADDTTDTDPEQLATAYREAVTNALVPIPDAETLLRDLRNDYRVGLLTNGPVLAQRSKIDYLGWEPLFDTTLVTGELAAGKPEAPAFDALLSELGTDPEETVFIGDTPDEDILGADDAGIYTVQVLFDGGPQKDPRADAYIERDRLAADLPGLLASL